jgi:hypothetical protein
VLLAGHMACVKGEDVLEHEEDAPAAAAAAAEAEAAAAEDSRFHEDDGDFDAPPTHTIKV